MARPATLSAHWHRAPHFEIYLLPRWLLAPPVTRGGKGVWPFLSPAVTVEDSKGDARRKCNGTIEARTLIIIRASLDSFPVDSIGDGGGGRVCSLVAVVVIGESIIPPVDVEVDPVPIPVPIDISVLFMSKLMRKASTCGLAGVTWTVVVVSIVVLG